MKRTKTTKTVKVRMRKATHPHSAGDVVPVDEIVAQRWISRGIAWELEEVRHGRQTEARREEGPEVEAELEALGPAEEDEQAGVEDGGAYREMSFHELRAAARELGVEGHHKMKKVELIEALEGR